MPKITNKDEAQNASAYEKLKEALSGYKGIRTITSTKLQVRLREKRTKRRRIEAMQSTPKRTFSRRA